MAYYKIAIISDTTYRACLPWDSNTCLSYYGSEPYAAILAYALITTGHHITFFAPQGSTPIGDFHPLKLTYSHARLDEYIHIYSIEEPRYNELRLANEMDFVIDMSAAVRNIESLYWFTNFRRYVVYRNGYTSYIDPKIPPRDRHYVVPSKQNQAEFAKAGFETDVIYYGIPDFYSPGESPEYWEMFEKKYGLVKKEYFLFPHRPTEDKGSDMVMRLAKLFPEENFVLFADTPSIDHKVGLYQFKHDTVGLKNVRIIEAPRNPWHHYYKREVFRNAKALLSPFNPTRYVEGFGLASKEGNACGTPVIVTDSPSSRELYRHEEDALVMPYDIGWFGKAIGEFDSYTFKCENRFPVENYAANYVALLESKYNV